jgi:hypothetical protein
MNRRLRDIVIVLLATASLGACTWVKPDARGEQIKVAYFGEPTHCEPMGEITVSVAHRVAGVRRSHMKVKDELESLARNAAPAGADTVVPQGEPVEGEQVFKSYRCR